MLVINGISKAFKDVKVLDNLSLKVDDASVFGLVGVNGAGKSTLLRSISGIYHLDAGNISFNGEDTYANPLIRKDIFFHCRSITVHLLGSFFLFALINRVLSWSPV